MTSTEKLRVLWTARWSGDQPWWLRWFTSDPCSSSSTIHWSRLCLTHSCRGVSPTTHVQHMWRDVSHTTQVCTRVSPTAHMQYCHIQLQDILAEVCHLQHTYNTFMLRCITYNTLLYRCVTYNTHTSDLCNGVSPRTHYSHWSPLDDMMHCFLWWPALVFIYYYYYEVACEDFGLMLRFVRVRVRTKV